MIVRVRSLSFATQPGNLGSSERWLSVLAGLGLTLAAVRGGGLLRRTALGAAGLSLLSRGMTGYCGLKSAASGERSFPDGLREQWQRTRTGLGGGAADIHSMHGLYTEELQELYSSEDQLHGLLKALEQRVEHDRLRELLNKYAADIQTRTQELQRMLSGSAADPRQHPDQAMRALIRETYKMAQVCAPNVRDAALVSSLQRLTHYRIAAYGSVASYAKSLGSLEEAARLSEYADREKTFDADLTELAELTLNPQATAEPEGHAAIEARTH